jgi:hypothetical protein
MNMNRLSIQVLVAGTLLTGGVTIAAQASAHGARAAIPRPNGVYSGGGKGPNAPAYQSVLVTVDKTGRKVTVDQRCELGVPGRKMTGTIGSHGKFDVAGAGIDGRMTARGEFVDPNAGGRYLEAVHMTITNGCTAGSRKWDIVLV